MKVLVIGGAGYIGSHVVCTLLDNEHDVLVFDDLSTGQEINLQEDVGFIKGSILDKNTLDKAMAQDIDAVIHLAALKAAGESMFKPEVYSTHNLTGTINVLNSMCEHDVKYFVFSSSAATYGMPQYNPIDENHPQNPINYYGYTKLAVEQLLQWYSQLKNIRYVSLRYFNAAGYKTDGRIKGLEQNPANLLPIIMEVQVGIREKLQVFGDDYDTKDGSCIRDYIHVEDLASGHLMGLEYAAKKNEDLVLNLGTGKGYSVLEMIKTVEEISAKPVDYEMGDRRMGDPAELIASADKAKQLLGWEAKVSDLNNLVSSTWALYEKNYLNDNDFPY